MTNPNHQVVGTLGPDDFSVISGDTRVGGRIALAAFGDPDSMDIIVDQHGSLCVSPRERTGDFANLTLSAGRWERV